jgi:hypothetical protein
MNFAPRPLKSPSLIVIFTSFANILRNERIRYCFNSVEKLSQTLIHSDFITIRIIIIIITFAPIILHTFLFSYFSDLHHRLRSRLARTSSVGARDTTEHMAEHMAEQSAQLERQLAEAKREISRLQNQLVDAVCA